MPKTREVQIPKTFTPRFIEHIDKRFAPAKMLRQRYEQLATDCGADSVQRQTLAKRAVFIQTMLETWECEALEHGIDADTFNRYISATNTLTYLLRQLGLDKVARDVTPSLHEYIATKKGNGK
jgi:hypothetical protein